MNSWKTYLPFTPNTQLRVTGKATGTLQIIEVQDAVLKISAKLDKWSWGALPVKAFDGEAEIVIVNEKKLRAKSSNKISRKSFETDAIEVTFKDDRFQVGSSGLKAFGEIVLVSPTSMTIELKVGGPFGFICRGPALFQLTKA